MLRVALAQTNMTVGDFEGNRTKILNFTKNAKKQQADIVVFPEMALCGYPPEDLLFHENFIQDNLRGLRAVAPRIKGITAVIGFVDQDQDKNLYNAAAVISGGKIKGIYHKETLPNYGVFDEKRYFKAGTKNPLFMAGSVVFGVSICEDIWLADATPKRQTQDGAKLLINLSSSPYDVGKLKERERLLKALAKDRNIYVCYCNLVGGQDELVFDGGSLVVDPQGRVMASGNQFGEDLLVADIPALARLRKKTKKKYILVAPASEKSRLIVRHEPKTYSQIERIFHALVLGTRDYVRKNGFEKVLVGLSGGVDSSLVAVIAREAIGLKNVVGVSMPSQYSSEGTRSDAEKLAENLKIKHIEVPIQDIFESYLKTLAPHFVGQKTDITEENIQARIRGNILMAFSNKFGWLVLTTGNKSEVAVGYCTLYGDMSGGFAVIKDVPKTLVYDLARFVNVRHDGVIPEGVLRRAPSAELRENQTDQDSLPSYEVLDPIIKGYVEKHMSFSRLKKKGEDPEVVRRVMSMIDFSEYKRRQAPPGIKITPRAFGKDWRLPITNKYKRS